jgi:general secretion pathway protein K
LSAGIEIAVAKLLVEDKEQAWLPNGDAHSITVGSKRLVVSIRDVNGLIDINKAKGEVILGLLTQFSDSQFEAEQIRDRILDWRDQDKKTGFRGAEDFQYERAGLPMGAGDANFIDVTQLTDVLDMPPALFRKILPFLTVHSSDGRIKPDAAPPEVLASIPAFSDAGSGSGGPEFQDRTELSSTEPGSASGTGKWITKETGAAFIIHVAEQANNANSVGLRAIIMVAADENAPYRVLFWGMVNV